MTTTANEYPTNREIVIKAIGADIWSYGNLMHRHFVTWCETIAQKHIYRDRDLITSQSILNYYQLQWKIRVDNRFVNENLRYINKSIIDHQTYYELICSYAEELEDHYPKSLLKNTPVSKSLDFTLN